MWYVKGSKQKFSSDNISDFLTSSEPDKALYKYQQSTEEASYIIKHLTTHGQVIADFCMGSGTSGVAALKLGRKFIGIERDKGVYEIAKRRISQYI